MQMMKRRQKEKSVSNEFPDFLFVDVENCDHDGENHADDDDVDDDNVDDDNADGCCLGIPALL